MVSRSKSTGLLSATWGSAVTDFYFSYCQNLPFCYPRQGLIHSFLPGRCVIFIRLAACELWLAAYP